MSNMLPRNSHIHKEVVFDKKAIIEEIKLQIPEPWVWYTVNDCMGDESFPVYDLVISKKKEVNEEISFDGNQFSSFKTVVKGMYSIVLGVDIIEKTTHSKFEMSDHLVTASIQVKSSREVFDILRRIDKKNGGINNG
jgi:hypothetical protein